MGAGNGFGTGFGVMIGLFAGLALLFMVACGGCMGLAWLGRQSRESLERSATHRAMQEAPPDRLPGGAVEPR